jgi:hypothetical protein
MRERRSRRVLDCHKRDSGITRSAPLFTSSLAGRSGISFLCFFRTRLRPFCGSGVERFLFALRGGTRNSLLTRTED